jgi:hypothetical protein
VAVWEAEFSAKIEITSVWRWGLPHCGWSLFIVGQFSCVGREMHPCWVEIIIVEVDFCSGN